MNRKIADTKWSQTIIEKHKFLFLVKKYTDSSGCKDAFFAPLLRSLRVPWQPKDKERWKTYTFYKNKFNVQAKYVAKSNKAKE